MIMNRISQERIAGDTQHASRRKITPKARLFDAIAPFFVIGSLLIAWVIATEWRLVTPFLLPPPAAVTRWIIDDVSSGKLFINSAWTIFRTFVSFALTVTFGVTIGILMSRSIVVFWFFDPIISIGLPIPKIALLPAFMVWFGLYDASKILMTAFATLFQVIATTWQATQSVDRELVWSARAVGASNREILWEIILPAASPQIITGLQITFPICLIVVLVTEMQMGGQGLGDAMLSSARYAKTAGVYAGIVEITFVGFCATKAMEWLRRRLLTWHQEVAKDEH